MISIRCFLISICVLFWVPINAQTALDLIQRHRDAVQKTPLASIYVNCTYHGFYSEDTAHYCGTIIYQRDSFDANNLCKFLLTNTSGVFQCANNLESYFIQSSDTIIQIYTENEFSRKILGKNNYADNLLPSAYLKKFLPIDTGFYQKAKVIDRANQWELVVADSMPFDAPFQGEGRCFYFQLTWTYDKLTGLNTSFEDIIFYKAGTQYRKTTYQNFQTVQTKIDDLISYNIGGKVILPQEEFFKKSETKVNRPIPENAEPLFNITFYNQDSTPVKLGDYPTQLLLLEYWYKGCYACILAMPGLEKIGEQYPPEKLRVIGVNPLDQSVRKMNSYLQVKNVHYPSLFDFEGKTLGFSGVYGYPTFLLIDTKSGRILFHKNGYHEGLEEEIKSEIDNFLNN